MLGICFFTYRGEYTGEPVWEGEKGVIQVAKKCLRIWSTNSSFRFHYLKGADHSASFFIGM
jgi:hypothetical protein